MFGYIRLSKDKKSNEAGLAQTFMCGLCLSTKRLFGQRARNYVNHDINFLNILFHSYTDSNPAIMQGKCLSSPFKKRSLLMPDSITDALSVANVLLCYASLEDAVRDKQRIGARLMLLSTKKQYIKARALNAQLDRVISEQCAKLVELERQKCASPDIVCDCFAQLIMSITRSVVPCAKQDLYDLTYNVGKWVYLIDALDDLDQDAKSGNYNVLLSYLGKEEHFDKQGFLSANKTQLQYLFFTALNRIAECYNDLNLNKFVCVLEDIVYNSIRNKTKELLGMDIPKTQGESK